MDKLILKDELDGPSLGTCLDIHLHWLSLSNWEELVMQLSDSD
jgi:hypothetical protein